MAGPSAPGSGDNARVFTGIRDVPIWAGESSQGNKLPCGPYRWPELVVIAIIMTPTLLWVRHNTQSPYLLRILAISIACTVILVVALRFLLPKTRPDVLTRLQFLINAAIPRPVATSARTPAASGRAPRPTSPSRRHRGSR